MKSRFYVLLLGLMVTFYSACKPTETEQGRQETTQAKVPVAEDQEEHGAVASVQLDRGQKWKANPETTSGIRNMQQFQRDFPANPTLEDFHGLSEKLTNEFQLIFERCTMTGAAHTQLHHYLLPLKEKIENLSANSIPDGQKAFEDIKVFLAAYALYFE